jgi:Flp pilus assembly protein TadG
MRCSRLACCRRRSGSAMVEFAVVAIVLFMLLIGIYEYGRYFMTIEIMENAAREGARYAVVHTYDDTVEDDTIEVVRDYLAGVDQGAFGTQATVSVFAADSLGNSTGSPLNAQFGTFIGVRVEGNYQTILPELLFLPSSIAMRVQIVMNSEAN